MIRLDQPKSLSNMREFRERYCSLTKEEPGGVKSVLRYQQVRDMQPKGSRGAWKNAPSMKIEHGVNFLSGNYTCEELRGSPAAADRTNKLMTGGGYRFDRVAAELIRIAGGESSHIDELNDLEELERTYFSRSPAFPSVIIHYRDKNGEPLQIKFLPPQAELRVNPAQRIESVEVVGDVFGVIAYALRLIDD